MILVISTAGYYGFSTTKQAEPTPTPQTVSVTTCDVEQTVTAPGNLVNVNIADINIPATGKLASVNVRVGDALKAGQRLADLDPVAKTQAQLDLLEAQETLEKAQHNRTVLEYPRATDDFIRDLRKRISNAKQVVNELESNYRKAEEPLMRSQILASLTAAKAELKNLESNMNWYNSKPSESDITNPGKLRDQSPI
jgi:macrolide-specific efflux system membrane fusion protein